MTERHTITTRWGLDELDALLAAIDTAGDAPEMAGRLDSVRARVWAMRDEFERVAVLEARTDATMSRLLGRRS